MGGFASNACDFFRFACIGVGVMRGGLAKNKMDFSLFRVSGKFKFPKPKAVSGLGGRRGRFVSGLEWKYGRVK